MCVSGDCVGAVKASLSDRTTTAATSDTSDHGSAPLFMLGFLQCGSRIIKPHRLAADVGEGRTCKIKCNA